MNLIKYTTKKMYRSLRVWPAVMLCGVMLVWTGCNADEFLTPDPSSFTTTANYYNQPDHFEAALFATYSSFRGWTTVLDGDFRIAIEMRSDVVNRQFDPNLPGIDDQNVVGWFMQSSNGNANWWNDPYQTIYRANIVLTRIDDVEWDDTSLRDQIVAEALVLRAASYYYLVQVYGDLDGKGVPLRLEETSSPAIALNSTRASTEAVLNQIVSDLSAAVGDLPAKGDTENGRITSGAANYLLGKTRLLTGDYPGAVTALSSLSANYSLLPTFLDVFAPNNNGNAESILEISFADNVAGQPNRNPEFVIPHHLAEQDALDALWPGLEGVDGSNSGLYPAYQVWDFFTDLDNDQRFTTGFTWSNDPSNSSYPSVAHTPTNTNSDSIATSNKWFWPAFMDGDDLDGNEVFWRYGDAVLALAEAHWQNDDLDDALDAINEIRDRAGLPPVLTTAAVDAAYPVPNILTGTYLDAGDANTAIGRAIFMERTTELLQEGHRMLDLMRFSRYNDGTLGFAQQVLQAAHDDRLIHEGNLEGQTSITIDEGEIPWPIPPGEIQNSEGDMQQNTYYQ